MQPLQDEPNDMWAVGTVLFQLLISINPEWDKQHGPFMFDPSDEDMLEGASMQDEHKRALFTRDKIVAEQALWVRLWLVSFPAAAQGSILVDLFSMN